MHSFWFGIIQVEDILCHPGSPLPMSNQAGPFSTTIKIFSRCPVLLSKRLYLSKEKPNPLLHVFCVIAREKNLHHSKIHHTHPQACLQGLYIVSAFQKYPVTQLNSLRLQRNSRVPLSTHQLSTHWPYKPVSCLDSLLLHGGLLGKMKPPQAPHHGTTGLCLPALFPGR